MAPAPACRVTGPIQLGARRLRRRRRDWSPGQLGGFQPGGGGLELPVVCLASLTAWHAHRSIPWKDSLAANPAWAGRPLLTATGSLLSFHR